MAISDKDCSPALSVRSLAQVSTLKGLAMTKNVGMNPFRFASAPEGVPLRYRQGSHPNLHESFKLLAFSLFIHHPLHFHHNRDRAVIDQLDIHVSTEDARLSRDSLIR